MTNPQDDLKAWFDTLIKKPVREDRRVINAAVHKKLDRDEPANDLAARMLEELEWSAKALELLQIRQTCKCGHSTLHTAGVFVRKTHPRRNGVRLVPVKFFPDKNLPRESRLVEEHLELCANCFIEGTLAEELADGLLFELGFAGASPADNQLALFAELPHRRSE